MLLTNPLIGLAMLFALLGLIFLIITIVRVKKRKLLATVMTLVTALLMLSLSALFGTISLATQGFHALTQEELAAIVKVEPAGEQKFIARFVMPNGSEKMFSFAGDQLFIDAHILKWKPLANIFGLLTSYELDRVAGRYTIPIDERTKVHTVYSLSYEKPLNMFDLRKRFAILDTLLDAEYVSATLVNLNSAEEFRLMVSTTGLLVRKINKEPGNEIPFR